LVQIAQPFDQFLIAVPVSASNAINVPRISVLLALFIFLLSGERASLLAGARFLRIPIQAHHSSFVRLPAMDLTEAFTPALHPCLSLVGARLAGLIDQAFLCVLATQLHHFGMQLPVHTSQVNGKGDCTRNPDHQDDIDHKDKVRVIHGSSVLLKFQ
jgi:hypothetical protein